MHVRLTVLTLNEEPYSYEGVELSYLVEDGDYTREVFMSGQPRLDWLTAGAVAHGRWGEDVCVQAMSAVDHFVMDGGEDIDGQDEPFTAEEVTTAVERARVYLDERGELPFRMTVKAVTGARGHLWAYLTGPIQGKKMLVRGAELRVSRPGTKETFLVTFDGWLIGAQGEEHVLVRPVPGGRRVEVDDTLRLNSVPEVVDLALPAALTKYDGEGH